VAWPFGCCLLYDIYGLLKKEGLDNLMSVSKSLLEILVCPRCKAKLDYLEEKAVLVCKPCKLKFRVEDDIPVMIIEEATPLEG
jgi:uncharacterized protein YbaR (Trm112 family)